MSRIENYMRNEGKELLENLNDNMWENNQFNYQTHGLLVINEYINVELMCLENGRSLDQRQSAARYQHLFDISEFKKAIICEYKVNEFFDEMKKLEIEFPNSNHHLSVDIIEIMSEMYKKLVEKLEYLLEEVDTGFCNYCGGVLEDDDDLYNGVHARHIPSYALLDSKSEEDIYQDIYPEYTKEELRDIEYNEERRGLGYVDECYEESGY